MKAYGDAQLLRKLICQARDADLQNPTQPIGESEVGYARSFVLRAVIAAHRAARAQRQGRASDVNYWDGRRRVLLSAAKEMLGLHQQRGGSHPGDPEKKARVIAEGKERWTSRPHLSVNALAKMLGKKHGVAERTAWTWLRPYQPKGTGR